jgi:hypothetical protein
MNNENSVAQCCATPIRNNPIIIAGCCMTSRKRIITVHVLDLYATQNFVLLLTYVPGPPNVEIFKAKIYGRNLESVKYKCVKKFLRLF